MDIGKSGVAAERHGAFAMEACRTPCNSVGRQSFSSRCLLAATYWVRSGRVQVAGAAWLATLCARCAASLWQRQSAAVQSRCRQPVVVGVWAEKVCVGFLVGFVPYRLERRRKHVTFTAA